jgi:hypothetical protein
MRGCPIHTCKIKNFLYRQFPENCVGGQLIFIYGKSVPITCHVGRQRWRRWVVITLQLLYPWETAPVPIVEENV